MPRILHLIDTGGPGGAETVLVNLATGLSRERWESRVLLPREDWLARRLAEEGIPVEVHRSRGTGDLGLLRRIVGLLRRFRPHLLHAHFLGSGVYGSLAAQLHHGQPVVCTLHGIPDVSPSDRLLSLKARILSRPRNRVVYVSHHLRRSLEPLLGVPARLGLMIHNGVPISEPSEPARLRAELGWGKEVKLVGAVGNVRPAKDYGNLLRAARKVMDERSDVRFVVVGEGREELSRELAGLQAELGLEEGVRFLGFRPDVPAVLASLDLFVSSSVNEGLPLASVEAMGMGKPVVLTACGGVPELVEHGGDGWLVPVQDPGALAEGILTLLNDPGLASRLASRARVRVREGFSLQAMVTAYERLYTDLIEASGGSVA